jgi:hypothetical protein
MHPTETPEDTRLLARLEACSLDDGEFGHAEHVHAAWVYLRRGDLTRAADRFAVSLRRFARARGATGLYHETITWAFLVVINERMALLPDKHRWREFAKANADLIEGGTAFLERFYRPETLHSERAKRTFVFPDRATAGRPGVTP